jgi:hypothetical protein
VCGSFWRVDKIQNDVTMETISVWRVTCYDHFCVFQFFSILAISMATAAILKN